MPNLFKKAAVFTDIHFGERSDSLVHNQDCLEFLDWFVEQAREHKVDRVIFVGDWFHNRTRIRLDTISMANQGVRKIREVTGQFDMVLGNHDMFYRDNRSQHSLDAYRDWAGVNVHDQHTIIDGVGFCPFLIGTEYLEVADMQADYIFGHFELPHFLMNSNVEKPDTGSLAAEHFSHPRMVFSGHFHKRQLKTNQNKVPVWYIGSPFGHNFNDVSDVERGMMILEWGEEPLFLDWKDGPLYQRFAVSELINMIETDAVAEHTRPKSILEVRDDVGLELEEISMIRDELLKHVREVRATPGVNTPGLDSEVDMEDLDGKDLDQIVEENLLQIDPRGSDIDPEFLVQMYKGEHRRKT